MRKYYLEGALVQPRGWAPPLLLIAAAFAIHLADLNRGAFLLLNHDLTRLLPPRLWEMITILGDGGVALALLLPFCRRHPKFVLTALTAGILAGLAAQLLKYGFDLPRPPAVLEANTIHIIGPGYARHSFPSGHASTLFALLGSFAMAAGVAAHRRLFALLLVTATLAALSRSVVGVHWPTDILTGAAIGWLSAFASTKLLSHTEPGATTSNWLEGFLAFCAVYLLFFHDTGYPDAARLQHALAFCALGLACLAWIPKISGDAPPQDPRAAR